MPEGHRVIGNRVIRHIPTGEICSVPAPVFETDWPYGTVSPNQPLLRYMDLWKFEDLLHRGALYFCRADKFDDPLEGTMSPEGVHGTSASDVAFFGTNQANSDTYAQQSKYRELARGTTFVSCWHINDRESQEMWDAYTSSSDSVLVVTTAERLAASLSMPVFGAAVKYVTADTPRTEFDERSLFYYKDVSFDF